MNCLEYRREKLADPRRLAPEAAEHGAQCEACRAFGAAIDDNEARLAEAFSVPVPEGLADRVLLRRKTGARWPVKLMALAATLLLTVSVGFSWWKDYASQDYARLAIEHVMHEPESFTTTRIADPEMFRLVMHNFGADLNGPLGRIRYMKLCPVPEGTGWHIVFETDRGLATLILIPYKRMQGGEARATVGGWNALAQPGGQGYYAIITPSPDTLNEVDRLIKQRVRWHT